MFPVNLREGQYTETMTYNSQIKGIDMKLQCESELEDKGQLFLFRDIKDHWTINESSSSYDVLVNREDGNSTWKNASVTRRDDPI